MVERRTGLALIAVAVGALLTPQLPALGQAPLGDGARYVKTRTPNPLKSNVLYDVSCWSGRGCMAVGGAGFDGKPRALALEHNRQGWKISRLPRFARGSFFNGVSCPSASRCVAVGYASHGKSLIAAWDGQSWRRQASRQIGEYEYFESVHCASRNSCLAVGAYKAAGGERALIKRWNGNRWSRVATESAGRRMTLVSDVDCYARRACTIVGTTGLERSRTFRPVVWRWRGERANLVARPQGRGELWGVDCVSAKRCYGVGSDLVKYNGSRWSDVAFPKSASTFLLDVHCLSSSQCAAVGYRFRSGPSGSLAAVHFNGSAWRRAELPAVRRGDWLKGLECTPAHCYAVGSISFKRTLALRG